jgi:hypothetical protein
MFKHKRVSGLYDLSPTPQFYSVTGQFDTDLILVGGDGNHGVTVLGSQNLTMYEGRLGLGNAVQAGVRILCSAATTTTGPLGAWFKPTIAAAATVSYYGYVSQPSTEAAAFTLPVLTHFAAEQGTIGAASAVTVQTGFEAQSSLTGATTNYGFRGSIAAASGRYNLYMDGTAQNYFGGVTIFNAPARLKGYTVATLPAGTVGDTAYVTDALTPTFLVAAVGGGAVVSPVFYNGAAWITY